MATVAALLGNRPAVTALRRSLPRGGPALTACRSLKGVVELLSSRLVEAVVASPRTLPPGEIQQFRRAFPGIPLLLFAPFRPDDGDQLLAAEAAGVSAIAVEGVDDAVVGDIVHHHSLTAERRAALKEAPRVLRLTEPLQVRVWDLLLAAVDQPVRTAQLARRLAVSREHLSRQFGAGGAPNLKRVIDLTRIVCAAQLLVNAGYEVGTVARLLCFASSSHLSDTARRICGHSAGMLGSLGPRGVLSGFTRGKTRSRV